MRMDGSNWTILPLGFEECLENISYGTSFFFDIFES